METEKEAMEKIKTKSAAESKRDKDEFMRKLNNNEPIHISF